MGYQVLLAARAARAGLDRAAIVALLEQVAPRTQLLAVAHWRSS